ncbi:MAG: hypothetical protein D6820_14835 [Lentisphaerae bacterium]|nr:MAG: hypothetical protein D6820_14835 [Lentisphaerota bacterium]
MFQRWNYAFFWTSNTLKFLVLLALQISRFEEMIRRCVTTADQYFVNSLRVRKKKERNEDDEEDEYDLRMFLSEGSGLLAAGRTVILCLVLWL